MISRKKKLLIPVIAFSLSLCLAGTAFAYYSHYNWSGWFPTLGQNNRHYTHNRVIQAIVSYDLDNGCAIDGYFGSETKSSVQAFQTSMGLTPDGIVGPQTWHDLQYSIYEASGGTSSVDYFTIVGSGNFVWLHHTSDGKWWVYEPSCAANGYAEGYYLVQ